MPETIGQLKGIKDGLEIEWSVSDIFSLPETPDVNYYSPKFYFGGDEWWFTLYPFGQRRDNSIGDIGCYLKRSDDTRPVNLEVKLGFKNKDGNLDSECSYTKIFDQNSPSWGCRSFISRLQLLEKKSDFAPSGVLTFFCKMTEIDPLISSIHFIGAEKLSDDLRKLMINGNASDLTVKLKEKEFKLHKIILGIRSPAFATTVKKEMEKTSTDIISINDCEELVFKLFIEYIYTGTVDKELLQKNFLDLYKIAAKYEVFELKEECLKIIKDKLSVDIFFDATKLAEEFDEKELKTAISKFCSDNLKDLVKNPKWLVFMEENTKKAYELLSTALTKYVKSHAE